MLKTNLQTGCIPLILLSLLWFSFIIQKTTKQTNKSTHTKKRQFHTDFSVVSSQWNSKNNLVSCSTFHILCSRVLVLFLFCHIFSIHLWNCDTFCCCYFARKQLKMRTHKDTQTPTLSPKSMCVKTTNFKMFNKIVHSWETNSDTNIKRHTYTQRCEFGVLVLSFKLLAGCWFFLSFYNLYLFMRLFNWQIHNSNR